MEDFRDSGSRFVSLDYKLSNALQDLVSGDLKSRILRLLEEESRAERMTRGRMILWLIYDHYAVRDDHLLNYSLTDLMRVKLKQDQLEKFLMKWDVISKGFKVDPFSTSNPDMRNTCCDTFVEELRKSERCKELISEYDRL